MANNPASVTDPDGGCTTKGGRPCVFSVMGGTATDAGGNIWSGAGDTPSALHTPFALSEVSISKGRTLWDDVSDGISFIASLLEGNSGSIMWANGFGDSGRKKGKDGEIYGSWEFNEMVIPGNNLPSSNGFLTTANEIVEALNHYNNLKPLISPPTSETVQAIRLHLYGHTEINGDVVKTIIDTTYIDVPVTTHRTKDSVRRANENMKNSTIYWLNN